MRLIFLFCMMFASSMAFGQDLSDDMREGYSRAWLSLYFGVHRLASSCGGQTIGVNNQESRICKKARGLYAESKNLGIWLKAYSSVAGVSVVETDKKLAVIQKSLLQDAEIWVNAKSEAEKRALLNLLSWIPRDSAR